MGTITIVDDDQPMLDGISRALRAEGYWVETFKDPIVALPQVIFEPPRLLILNGRSLGCTASTSSSTTAATAVGRC